MAAPKADAISITRAKIAYKVKQILSGVPDLRGRQEGSIGRSRAGDFCRPVKKQ
jgi:hypothetical protein